MGLSFVRLSMLNLMIAGYEIFCEDAMICLVPMQLILVLGSKQTS